MEKLENEEWQKSANWADLIVMGDNNKWLRELDIFRKKGYPVFAPSYESAQLEQDRGKGQALFKKSGMNVIPYEVFSNLRKAEKYVMEQKGRFVSKPYGDKADKALTYVAKTAADMVFMLRKWDKDHKINVSFMLQEYVEGIEFGVAGWLGKAGFEPWFEEHFEHKKVMVDDFGPNCGEAGTAIKYVKDSALAKELLLPLEDELVRSGHTGSVAVGAMIDESGEPRPLEFTCYDDQTEVLTKSGWRLFKDVSVGDLVATLDPDSGTMEYRPSRATISQSYVGEMIHFSGKSSAPDLCVTPDHQMWVRSSNGNKFVFLRADEVEGKAMQIKRSASWIGRDQPIFSLPGRIEPHSLGRHKKIFPIEHPPIDMSMECWLRFLGLYISEGSIGQHGYVVTIAQAHHNHQKILPLLSGFPIPFKVCKNGALQFSNKQLAEYLQELVPGKCNTKFIPEEVKELDTRYLSALLEGLMAGDGSTHKRTGQRVYFSTSEQLAGDVQELMLKLGSVGRIVKQFTAGTVMEINGKEYTRNHDIYAVCERREKLYGWTDKRTTKRVQYNGEVYCLDVPPHHLLYVRRNGNASWCGNCRLGWPSFNICQALHPEPVEWMAHLVDGEHSFEPTEETAVGMVIAMPDFPYSFMKESELLNVPLYHLDADNPYFEQIMPTQVMSGVAPAMEDGEVVEKRLMVSAGNYLAVATGTGDNVSAAHKECLKAVKSLEIPNDPIVRTDIGEGLKQDIPKLQEYGFALDWRYA